MELYNGGYVYLGKCLLTGVTMRSVSEKQGKITLHMCMKSLSDTGWRREASFCFSQS